MPLTRQALPLKANPRSIKDARDWVTGILEQVGREDLLESARLGTTELATNALLHATSPMAVRVRGTRDNPRIEVFDGATTPPRLEIDRFGQDQLLATIGRGLRLVAMHSVAWGCDIELDGKLVWFEPSAETNESDALPEVQVVDFKSEVERAAESARADEGRIPVRLLDMPPRVFAAYRLYYLELRRELRLLSLRSETPIPVARDLGEQFRVVEAERQRATGIVNLDRAIEAGQERVDLEYLVPSTAGETMKRMRDLLLLADEFCRARKLLSLSASDQLLALQDWYVGEFVRQSRGEPPTPWQGEFDLDTDQGRRKA